MERSTKQAPMILQALSLDTLYEVVQKGHVNDLDSLSRVSSEFLGRVREFQGEIHVLRVLEGTVLRASALRFFPRVREVQGPILLSSVEPLRELRKLFEHLSGDLCLYWPGAPEDIRNPSMYQASNLREAPETSEILDLLKIRIGKYPRSRTVVILSRLFRIEYDGSTQRFVCLAPMCKIRDVDSWKKIGAYNAPESTTTLQCYHTKSIRKFLEEVPVRSFGTVDVGLDPKGNVHYLKAPLRYLRARGDPSWRVSSSSVETLEIPICRYTRWGSWMVKKIPKLQNVHTVHIFPFEPLESGSELFLRWEDHDLLPAKLKRQIQKVTGISGVQASFVNDTQFPRWNPEIPWKVFVEDELQAYRILINHSLDIESHLQFHNPQGHELTLYPQGLALYRWSLKIAHVLTG